MGEYSRLKRTPLSRGTKSTLKRSKPLKRSPMKRKRRRGDKPEVRYEFMSERQSCAICWARSGQFGVVLHCHHLVPGNGRVDVRANFLTLCDRCHRHLHDGGEVGHDGKRLAPLTPGHTLLAKAESDAEGYDIEAILGLLARRAMPERWRETDYPAWVYGERERNMR